ncbi:PEP-CTERM sorting domain-containing protein [Sphingoaurantiacus capsulatus]|uniref:PEP-CTERM sorting domain-containing protein n=1 Tax=Sphingoaurantiacus capsulatus TaxID=1771310 RepID=A0ABV7X660_9SPHN
MKHLKLAALAATALFAAPALAAPTYTLTDIGDLAGGFDYSTASGINIHGQVVGGSSTVSSSGATVNRAFVWTNGVMTELPRAPGAGNTFGDAAFGINDSGQIVGNMNGPAVIWQNGSFTPLNPSGPSPSAYAINNSGQVASYAGVPGGNVAARWENGVATAFADIPGGPTSSTGAAINNHGVVAGRGTDAAGNSNAAIFTAAGQATSLGDLPGGGFASSAQGINDAGHVVGWGSAATGSRAFLWVNGVMTDLGDLAGGANSSTAYDINNAGRIVGTGYDAMGSQALMWFESQIFSLASLVSNLGGWRLTHATALNERGQIVGYGQFNGNTRAFLLTPDEFDVDPSTAVPEPAALTLFGLGIVGLGLRRRRRKAATN